MNNQKEDVEASGVPYISNSKTASPPIFIEFTSTHARFQEDYGSDLDETNETTAKEGGDNNT